MQTGVFYKTIGTINSITLQKDRVNIIEAILLINKELGLGVNDINSVLEKRSAIKINDTIYDFNDFRGFIN